MNKDIYCKTVQDKENKFCTIETTAGVYEGVFLRNAKPGNDLLMIIRPTGKTREMLANIAMKEDCSCMNEVGVLVESIVTIEFAS